MLRAIRRFAVNLIVPSAVALPVVAGIVCVVPKVDGSGNPCECHSQSRFAHLRRMNYGPDEIVYLLPDYTPIRFGDLPRAIIPDSTASADACSSPPGGPGARPASGSSTR